MTPRDADSPFPRSAPVGTNVHVLLACTRMSLVSPTFLVRQRWAPNKGFWGVMFKAEGRPTSVLTTSMADVGKLATGKDSRSRRKCSRTSSRHTKHECILLEARAVDRTPPSRQTFSRR